jgi:hypothetical protein
MVSVMTARWSEILSHPTQIAAGAYVIIGILVVGVVVFRGPKWRRGLGSGPLWEAKDHGRNVTWFLQSVFFIASEIHPLAIVLQRRGWEEGSYFIR